MERRGLAGKRAEVMFWASLVVAMILTAVLGWLLIARPAWTTSEISWEGIAILYALRVWTAIAWLAVVIAGFRMLRR
ncbi:MAG TPA: hypothetical protein VHS99_12705 [Chloroflexota bacterium]|jgi:hypothetical protein|nr:hypothetical protein [Chloroflexota bacterium]